MAYPAAGKGIKITVATASSQGTAFSALGLLTQAEMRHESEVIDVSVMSSSGNKEYIHGLRGGSITFSGIYPGTSDAGYAIVRDAWLNDTEIHARYLVDGSTGFQAEVKVPSFQIGGTVDGRVEYSGEFRLTGTIGGATGTSS